MLTKIGPTDHFPRARAPPHIRGKRDGHLRGAQQGLHHELGARRGQGHRIGNQHDLRQPGSTLSLAVAFLVMATVTPAQTLVKIFLGISGSGTPASIASFVDSIHLVFVLSTVFLLDSYRPIAHEGGRRPPETIVVEEGGP